MTRPEAVADAVAEAVRDQWARVVASVMRDTRDLQLAEDAAQDAVTEALVQWSDRGVPDRPGAWLTTVARRRALDRVRRSRVGAEKQQLAARLTDRVGWSAPPVEDLAAEEDRIRDDELRLLFLCCHPSLAPESQVALTLRSVAGLTTTEIARAFLVPEATMAQRLVRAKRKVRLAGIPFSVPDDDLLAERVDAVLSVVYLVFNEGYASADDRYVRTDLCDEAIRLGRLLVSLLPGPGEVSGLLALMLLNHARRDARVSGDGRLVLLDDQDRSRWRGDEMAEALRLLPRGVPAGPYALQAAIAAEHARAPTPAVTDWSRIARLYDRLLIVTGSPVVALNRAVAVSRARGPAEALPLVEALIASGELDGYQFLHSAHADLLRQLGRPPEAAAAYRRALALGPAPVERRFLESRLAEVAGPA